jgi:hypothetical protein
LVAVGHVATRQNYTPILARDLPVIEPLTKIATCALVNDSLGS